MSHTFTSLLTHAVWSTRSREPLLDPDLEARLYPYLGGIVRQLGGKSYCVNGSTDHIHILFEVPPKISVAECIGKIKGSSSKWIHESMPERFDFAWQRGYGSFSVSKSNLPSVARYIERQKIHHAKVDFESEFLVLLRKHGVAFEERYVFD
ncbi:MAG TPA: IS200/IS605 family transposase [Thermoanaerobaculia bacterium]